MPGIKIITGGVDKRAGPPVCEAHMLFFKKLLTALGNSLPLGKLDLVSWLNFYRYISLLVVLIVFFAAPSQAPLYLKISFALILLLEAFLFIRAFTSENTTLSWKKILIFAEILGILFIAAFTGGIASPFLWYAANPIILAATLSALYFCWSVLAFFLAAIYILQKSPFFGVTEPLTLWPAYGEKTLFFILVTVGGTFFSYLCMKLSEQSRLMEQKIGQIKSLYEAMEVISHHTDPQEIVNLFASYGRALTGAKKVIVWVETQFGPRASSNQIYYAVRGPRKILSEKSWLPYLKKVFEEKVFEEKEEGRGVETKRIPSTEDSPGGHLIIVRVRSSSRFFGVLSAFYQGGKEDLLEAEQTLTFLADLCAVALEKRSQEALLEEFMLVEEKDRIAGEIHDHVTQNIFGLIYGLETLIKKENFEDHVRQQLRLMQKTAQKSLQELRASIYRISSYKNKVEPFLEEVKRYLFDLGQLNSVTINFDWQGDLGAISSQVRKSLYRILKEATSNAIRHGNCNKLDVLFKALPEKISLTIADDGRGFDPNLYDYGGESGLGILNMKELARNIGGNLIIESGQGKGATVCCEVPRSHERTSAEKEELIL